MRDQITRQELQTAFVTLQMSGEEVERLTNTISAVQGLEITEELKLCSGLTTDDEGKTVFLANRRISGTMYSFYEETEAGEPTFYLSIDYKIHKFRPDSLIILQKTFRGAETLIDEG